MKLPMPVIWFVDVSIAGLGWEGILLLMTPHFWTDHSILRVEVFIRAAFLLTCRPLIPLLFIALVGGLSHAAFQEMLNTDL